jgi:hypothetical protein
MGQGPPRTLCIASILLFMLVAGCGGHRRPTAPTEPSPAEHLSVGPRPSLPFLKPIRAAYFYSYVSTFHLDSLARTGFTRAVIKFIGDSLDTRGASEMTAWMDKGARVMLEVAPAWSLQARSRLSVLPTARRYTWGSGTVESDVGCPLDSLFWRSAFLDHARELLGAAPGVKRLALDLEIYTGTPHHYVDPCVCPGCQGEFSGAGATDMAAHNGAPGSRDPFRLRASRNPGSGEEPAASPRAALLEFEEARLTDVLTALVEELARTHPGVELGIFDLDRDSFVHRAMGRALMRARVATVDYTERTYTTGATSAPPARAALEANGVFAPVVGGLWLKQFTPAQLTPAAVAMLDQAEGYFLFTTFSLWVEPSKRTGAYALQGTPEEYWSALRRANP